MTAITGGARIPARLAGVRALLRRRGSWWTPAGIGLVVLAAIGMAALAALPATGSRLLIVTSGSMRPAIQPGDALVVSAVDPARIEVGELVTFQGYGRAGLVTHRVIGRHDVGGRPHLLTKGDANPGRDPDAVPPEGLVGVVRLRLPGAGWALRALTTETGRILLLGLPAAVLAATEIRALWRLRRQPTRLVRSLTTLDRSLWSRVPAIAATASVVLLLAGGQLVRVAASGAVLAETRTIADNTVATTDVVAPTNVSATFDCGTLGLGKGIVVEWDAVSGADGYEVARSTTSGGPYVVIASVDASTTSHLDTDVENDTTYHYVVRTLDGDWTSEDSAEASETTPGSTDCLL